jgi:hypothetical protein
MFGVKNPWEKDDFEAYDAAQLTQQGIGEGAVAQNLGAAGIQDAPFMAADAENMRQMGMSQADMTSKLTEDYGTSDFDMKGLLSSFGKAFGDEGAAASETPMMKVGTLQRGSGNTVQALPEYKRPTPASTGAEAIKQAAMMYARQQPQMQPGQPQPTLIQKMLFGM